MRIELWILLITAFLIYNAYHDGKYTKMIMSYKKYYTMIFYCILGLGVYLLFKRNPNQGKNMLQYANNVVKYMPIDKSSLEMFSPILDFTSNEGGNNSGGSSFMSSFYNVEPSQATPDFRQQRMMQSGKTGSKRSVSETKKKYVASNQDWKCGNCDSQLDHTMSQKNILKKNTRCLI